MTDLDGRVALAELLRARRAALTPADVGLPTGTRRRTPGLRREEVAQLANISSTYYTFLEQGRPVHPSNQILDALAGALQLSAAERRYLDVLVNGGPGVPAVPELLPREVVELVDQLGPRPSFVKGRRWDVLASNASARELFPDWDGGNLVLWMFTSKVAQRVYLDWETEARAMLGRFRLAAARHSGDADFARLIGELTRTSDLARQWWPEHHVEPIGNGVKKLRHPRLGPLAYSHVVLQLADNPEQTLVTYSDASTLSTKDT